MKTLQAKAIVKSFGGLEVLRGLSLTFEPGTVTALVGDNGAGKSTLLKILAGAQTADSGSVTLGEDTFTTPTAARLRAAGIEMVPQDLGLAKHHSVVANLFMGREIAPWGFLNKARMSQEARQILQQLAVHIPDVQAAVGLLSGGQQQAVAIARALLFNPCVLLLDEPTAALAAREVERVLTLIKEQRALGRVIILVSHRLQDVFAVADRIIVLKRGTVFADDSVAATSLGQVVERIVS